MCNLHSNSLTYFDEKSGKYNFFGKFEFREKLHNGLIKENDVRIEIISQVLILC